jgi:hypothetical protein
MRCVITNDMELLRNTRKLMLKSATPKRYDAICVLEAVNWRPNMVAESSRELRETIVCASRWDI